VFVFSVTTALVVGDQEKVSVIVPAAEMVAVLAAIALIRSLQCTNPAGSATHTPGDHLTRWFR
jgi:hypothetical protein